MIHIAAWWALGLVAAQNPPQKEPQPQEPLREVQELRERLTEREDEPRSKNPLVVDLFGNPLTLNGQYEIALSFVDRLSFESGVRPYGETIAGQQLEGEAFYTLGEPISFFLQLRGIMEEEFDPDNPDDISDLYFERGEMWIYAEEPANLPLVLELGRLDFEDDRLWWWDEDLDAFRLTVELKDFDVALAVAHEMFPSRSGQGYVEPEHEDVLRLIMELSWDWSDDHAVQLFGLFHDDRSKADPVGTVLRRNREDEFDAKLLWLGARANGAVEFEDAGLLGYWADVGAVHGRERVLETDAISPSKEIVDGVRRHDVRGWAFDVGGTYMLPFEIEPRITVGYAFGSADGDPADGTDRSYQQTRLHGNEPGFGGVERFKGYGDLLDPELSNLSIVTAGVGISLLEHSSLDLVFHDYRLVKRADALRDARIEIEMTGLHRDVGRAFDLLLGLEEWDTVQFRVSVSALQAGDAFGRHEGDWILGGLFEFRVVF